LARARSPRLLQIVLDKCPSPERPSEKRFRWFPERGEDLQKDNNKVAWAASMHWDCIFLSELYGKPVVADLSRQNSPFDPFVLSVIR
jgi:hypothetical protein